MRKAQTTIETMMAVGVVLTFMLIVYAFILYPRMQESNYAQTYYRAKSVCYDLSSAINTVAFNDNGFSKGVVLPQRLAGIEYNITIYNNSVSVWWGKGAVYCQIRARNVTFDDKYPPFNLTVQSHVFNNSMGVVKIV